MACGEIQYKDIKCLRHLKGVFDLLESLHDVGCERDSAGNRQLHFDGYCKLVLLHIWNPLLESVPDLQRAVGLPQVAKALGVPRSAVTLLTGAVSRDKVLLVADPPADLEARLTALRG